MSGVWCLVSLVLVLVDGFLYDIVLVLAPRTELLPSPTSCPQLLGGPCGQPASQPAPATASQPSSQTASCHPEPQKPNPELLQASRMTLQLSKPLKTNSFQWFLLRQPGDLQHPFWMPEAPRLTPNDFQRQSRSSQAHPKCSLEAPKVIPNAPIWSHCDQSEPNLSPGGPKIHPKTPKMLPK